MIPVYQTKFGMPDGNCLSACIASLLERPLREVPDYKDADWWQNWENWLQELGFEFIYQPTPEPVPQGYAIAGVHSPRGPWLHAVICFDGKVIHDPYPGADKTEALLDWMILRPLDPA